LNILLFLLDSKKDEFAMLRVSASNKKAIVKKKLGTMNNNKSPIIYEVRNIISSSLIDYRL
jgi:hypothetical protein